jgi:hypothetical protein
MAEMVDRDQEHLRILAVCYYLLAGCTAFVSLVSLLYVGFGAIFLSGLIPANQPSNADPRIMGYIFTALGIAFFLFGLAMCFLYYLTGRSLNTRRRRTLCYAMSGFSCLYIPFGTAIGICTIMVLNRTSVKSLFASGQVVPQGTV